LKLETKNSVAVYVQIGLMLIEWKWVNLTLQLYESAYTLYTQLKFNKHY